MEIMGCFCLFSHSCLNVQNSVTGLFIVVSVQIGYKYIYIHIVIGKQKCV